ncbi:hypothetical protein H1R20_g12262, partial [Candolleomyces eurysporus]
MAVADNCVEPDIFGYIDQNGKEQVAQIPKDERRGKAVCSALDRENLEAPETGFQPSSEG